MVNFKQHFYFPEGEWVVINVTLSSNWLVQSSRSDLALNLVINDPPPLTPNPRKVEIQLEIDYIYGLWTMDSFGIV